MDPWVVTPVERARHIDQFRALNPIDGVITGVQAKGLLLQSGLPPPVLGQIWSLADANCDGKMDEREFSKSLSLPTLPSPLTRLHGGIWVPLSRKPNRLRPAPWA